MSHGIGERIRKQRDIHGYTQAQLAVKLNISHQSISKWEREESMPEINMVIKLSEIFNVSTDYILLGIRRYEQMNLNDKTIKPLDELTYDELKKLFPDSLMKDCSKAEVKRLQELGYVNGEENHEWTKEGIQLRDEYWYKACDAILKEIENEDDVESLFLKVNERVDLPRLLFMKFFDELVEIGKISKVTKFMDRSK